MRTGVRATPSEIAIEQRFFGGQQIGRSGHQRPPLQNGSSLLVVLRVLAAAAGVSPGVAGVRARQRGGELVASLRSEPGNYNRYFDASAAADVMTLLTQARLVRVNRVTDALEPALAESWDASADGRTQTLRLRKDVKFSDGAPFTVGRRAVLVRRRLRRAGQPARRQHHGRRPASRSHGAGCRHGRPPVSDAVRARPADPRQPADPAAAQARGRASRTGRFRRRGPRRPRCRTSSDSVRSFCPTTSPDSGWCSRGILIIGGKDQRQAPLPYLDRLIVEIIPDQNAEALRLESGAIDLMSNADIRPDDYARFKRLADQGRLTLLDAGIGLDPNVLWFNLKPGAAQGPEALAPPHRVPAGGVLRRRPAGHRQHRLSRRGRARRGPDDAAASVRGIRPTCRPIRMIPARARRLLAAAGLTDRERGWPARGCRRRRRCGSRCWCRRTPRFASARSRSFRSSSAASASPSTSSGSTWEASGSDG